MENVERKTCLQQCFFSVLLKQLSIFFHVVDTNIYMTNKYNASHNFLCKTLNFIYCGMLCECLMLFGIVYMIEDACERMPMVFVTTLVR